MAMHAEREHTKHAEPHGRVVYLAGVGNREPADAVGRDPYSLHDGEGRRASALALRTALPLPRCTAVVRQSSQGRGSCGTKLQTWYSR